MVKCLASMYTLGTQIFDNVTYTKRSMLFFFSLDFPPQFYVKSDFNFFFLQPL